MFSVRVSAFQESYVIVPPVSFRTGYLPIAILFNRVLNAQNVPNAHMKNADANKYFV